MNTFEELTAKICDFRDQRDWMQFHQPKDMAVAIAAEAGELMQHFVWKTTSQSELIASQKKDLIAEEMADIAILLFEMASNLKIDLKEAIELKLKRNAEKYPISKSKGSNRKYNEHE
jgi:NTP pyrophosphatase (non-canonical NTP hydrolase)